MPRSCVQDQSQLVRFSFLMLFYVKPKTMSQFLPICHSFGHLLLSNNNEWALLYFVDQCQKNLVRFETEITLQLVMYISTSLC